jgi:hypothetical protein
VVMLHPLHSPEHPRAARSLLLSPTTEPTTHGALACRCVLGLFLLCFIVVSAKLHKRRRRRQYLQAELKAEAKRAAAMAIADGVHDLSQLSDPQVSTRPPPSTDAVPASVCICNALYPTLLLRANSPPA